jgi:hypothetical protein
MAYLLAIDPGRCTGWALFTASCELHTCGVTSIASKDIWPLEWVEHPTHLNVVIELPQIYRAAQSKGDPNDLIQVAEEVGRWRGRFESIGVLPSLVKPAEWKGQVPKDVHHARASKVLFPAELARIPKLPKTQAHNMMDAVALGLWRLSRMR